MKESKIQASICTYLTKIGAKYTKTVANTKAGDPDLIVCYKGLYYGIEVKKPGEVPTELQTSKLLDISNAGGFAMFATSAEDIKQHLIEGQVYNKLETWYVEPTSFEM